MQTSLYIGNDGKSEASLTMNDDFQGELHITIDCMRSDQSRKHASYHATFSKQEKGILGEIKVHRTHWRRIDRSV